MTVDKGVTAGDAWVTVAPANIHAALSALKDGGYRLLVFLTCVDHLADSSREWPARYEIVYQLRDMETRDQLRVRTFIDGDPPHIESAYDLFPPANWDERETYDMFGIVFDNHPDLTRILMPEDWEGHPLRKDYATGRVPVQFKEAPAQR